MTRPYGAMVLSAIGAHGLRASGYGVYDRTATKSLSLAKLLICYSDLDRKSKIEKKNENVVDNLERTLEETNKFTICSTVMRYLLTATLFLSIQSGNGDVRVGTLQSASSGYYLAVFAADNDVYAAGLHFTESADAQLWSYDESTGSILARGIEYALTADAALGVQLKDPVEGVDDDESAQRWVLTISDHVVCLRNGKSMSFTTPQEGAPVRLMATNQKNKNQQWVFGASPSPTSAPTRPPSPHTKHAHKDHNKKKKESLSFFGAWPLKALLACVSLAACFGLSFCLWRRMNSSTAGPDGRAGQESDRSAPPPPGGLEKRREGRRLKVPSPSSSSSSSPKDAMNPFETSDDDVEMASFPHKSNGADDDEDYDEEVDDTAPLVDRSSAPSSSPPSTENGAALSETQGGVWGMVLSWVSPSSPPSPTAAAVSGARGDDDKDHHRQSGGGNENSNGGGGGDDNDSGDDGGDFVSFREADEAYGNIDAGDDGVGGSEEGGDDGDSASGREGYSDLHQEDASARTPDGGHCGSASSDEDAGKRKKSSSKKTKRRKEKEKAVAAKKKAPSKKKGGKKAAGSGSESGSDSDESSSSDDIPAGIASGFNFGLGGDAGPAGGGRGATGGGNKKRGATKKSVADTDNDELGSFVA